jgi:fumarylacetoacetase
MSAARPAAIDPLDETHDPRRRSWVASANGHADFPIQNLPLGIFSPGGQPPRGGVAIGDAILDLTAALAEGLFSADAARAAEAGAGPTLNALIGMGAGARRALRRRVSELLSSDSSAGRQAANLSGRLLHQAAGCTLHLPAAIGDYTDFFCGIHHAENGGRINRPGTDPLAPNYKYVPIAYHGRASSVDVPGAPVRRPNGQRLVGADTVPTFGPSEKLDYEFEFGVWIGPGNAVGEPIPIADAHQHIAGFCLLNDWSARDIQRWESQPLGPFLAKNFRTTVSPWIVTVEALAPFRVAQPPRPAGDPAPLDYLFDAQDQRHGALDVALEALILTPGLRLKGLPPHRVSLANTTDLYWTFGQMVAHHTCGGCNLAPGDLFGTGTISGPTTDGCGCLMERSENGRNPIVLASGETRTFLEDGDEVILRAHCRREGWVGIGFGECRGTIAPGH